MEELGKVHQLVITVMNYKLVFNLDTILMTWIVISGLLIFGYFAARKKSLLPEPVQAMGELFVSQLFKLTEDALDEEMARKYGPLVCALFLFLLFSNWLGMLPHLSEPTKDLNTPLSLGIMGFCIAHYAGIKEKGIKKYLKEYCEPIFILAPLNVIGEISKIISISFRLFGNIMGGSIIIIVVSYLIYSIILPPFLIAFFSLFVGAIQAFVFTMLTIVYISVQVK